MIHTAPIANTNTFVYDLPVAKTKATRFSSLNKQRRTHRPKTLAVFLRLHYALERPLWMGYGWGTYGYADSLCYQSANLTASPSAPFSSGRWVKPNKGAYTMAAISIPAHSEQTHTPNTFHLAARAARKAARQWYCGIPAQTLAAWRDTARKQHCEGLPNADMRSQAFDDAFAREIGNLIIAGGRVND